MPDLVVWTSTEEVHLYSSSKKQDDPAVSSSDTSLRTIISAHPGWWGAYGVTFALSLFVATLGLVGLADDLALSRDGVITWAQVTEERTGTRRGSTFYEVRYELRVPDDSAVYSHGDATGRAGLWVRVTEAAHEQAVGEGRLQVRYVPRDPSNNLPVDAAGSHHPVGNQMGAFCFALLLLVLAVVPAALTVRVVRRQCWDLVDATESQWTLTSDTGERLTVEESTVATGRFLELPRARVRPPWRFPSHVLVLFRSGQQPLHVRAPTPDTRPMSVVLELLKTRSVLRVKRQS